MGDLLAGTVVKGNDTPTTVSDVEAGSYTFTNATYGVSTTGGTYADCGVAFTAPTTGRVKISYEGQLSNSGANGTILSPHVRTGSTVGSGTDVLAASDTTRIFIVGTNGMRAAGFRLLTGLTPGSAYNVRLEHKVTGGTGTALHREVMVEPAT